VDRTLPSAPKAASPLAAEEATPTATDPVAMAPLPIAIELTPVKADLRAAAGGRSGERRLEGDLRARTQAGRTRRGHDAMATPIKDAPGMRHPWRQGNAEQKVIRGVDAFGLCGITEEPVGPNQCLLW
jgi:hypothetical protein